MRRQKRDYLTSHLQFGHIPVEVDPVEAFDVQYDVTIEHIIDVDRLGHLDTSASEPRYVLHAVRHRTLSVDLGGLRRVRRRASLKASRGSEQQSAYFDLLYLVRHSA